MDGENNLVTTAPNSSTTFLFSTSETERATTHDRSLDVYERTFLIIFELMCTVLTILLNGYLIYTILFKVILVTLTVSFTFFYTVDKLLHFNMK